MGDWVIDTCVLIGRPLSKSLDELDDEEWATYVKCLEFVEDFRQSEELLILDNEGKILAEYEQHVPQEFLRWFLDPLELLNRIDKVEALGHPCVKEAVKRFPDLEGNDEIFLRTALRSRTKRLITIDQAMLSAGQERVCPQLNILNAKEWRE